MALIYAMLPKGYAAEKKAAFLDACKTAIADGFKMRKIGCNAAIYEYDDACMEDTLKNTVTLLCYTATRKGLPNKADLVAAAKRECDRVLGPDPKRRTQVIFEEHEHDFISTNGLMRSEDAEMIAYLKTINPH